MSNTGAQPGSAGSWPVPAVHVITATQAAQLGHTFSAEGDGFLVMGERCASDHAEVHLAAAPVEQLGKLQDPALMDNFLTRVYCHARWRELTAEPLSLSRHQLQLFHQRYKYMLMATDREQYRALGRMVASYPEPPAEFAQRYFPQLIEALRQLATRQTHTNVLQHLAGYLKKPLSAADKRQLQDLVQRYRTGLVPLAEPVALLKRHFLHHPHPYISDQAYLYPYPDEIHLRHLF